MDASEQTLCPVAVGLHTRDRQEDYRWIGEVGPGRLTGTLKELHRGLIADQDARPAPTFVLLDHGERVGLLVANLKTSRQDHLRTHIDDTLLLEFGGEDRGVVYRVTAGLLATESPAIQRRLLDYAEERFRQQASSHLTAEPLALPPVAAVPGSDDLLTEPRVGLRSTGDNQRRVAGLLHYLADHPPAVRRPFVVVSTGFVGREKLQQQAVGRQFIALTRSSSFPEGEEVSLAGAGEEKKKSSRPQRKAVLVGGLLAGLLGVSLGGWVLLGNKSSNGYGTPSSDPYAKKSTDSEARSPGSGRRSRGSGAKSIETSETEIYGRSLQTATWVGMGATPHGQWGLLAAVQQASAEAPDR